MLFDDLLAARRAGESAGVQYRDTMSESIDLFHESIGMKIDPAEKAMAAHKELLELRGIEWDDTDVSQIEELAAMMEETIPGEYMGGPRGLFR